MFYKGITFGGSIFAVPYFQKPPCMRFHIVGLCVFCMGSRHFIPRGGGGGGGGSVTGLARGVFGVGLVNEQDPKPEGSDFQLRAP